MRDPFKNPSQINFKRMYQTYRHGDLDIHLSTESMVETGCNTQETFHAVWNGFFASCM